ncbi:MAG: superoxide dismutase family protein [Mycobacterium sp.]|nr:superoxide dismutase family protein [Mycobacterium sp.]
MVNSARFAALFVAPVALLSACAPNEPIATQPGTVPPVWTGSPAPAPTQHHGAMGHQAPGPNAPAAPNPANTMTAVIDGPDGSQVAAATIEFRDGDAFATVTVQTTTPGKLAPGAHGLHIHDVGKCEINSVAPNGGAPGDFLSAGGHFQGGGQGGHPNHAGDLTSLQVRGDGTALLVTTTNAFDMADLVEGDGTAIIIHANPDNFANIPADRYQQSNGAPPPDETTLATGDGGKRVGCGVLRAG